MYGRFLEFGALSLLLGAAAGVVSSCSDPGPAPDEEPGAGSKPLVLTTNYPVTYFAQRIGGKHVDLRFPAPPEGDPAFWQPRAEEVAVFQSAALVLLNGASYEKWLDRVSLPRHLLADTSAGFASEFIQVQDAVTHNHGKEGAHAHSGTAFTTWLDLRQAQQQAEAIRAALVRLVPAAEADLNQRASALKSDLEKLDADLREVAKAIGDRPLVASHPVYQYFARRYQLRIEPVLWEPEVVPDEAALDALKGLLAQHPAQWMIWEGEPAAASVAKLAALGIKSVVFDPCGNRPESGDWLSVMRQNVANLQSVQ